MYFVGYFSSVVYLFFFVLCFVIIPLNISYNLICMKVFLRHKDLHAYGKICESVHKTASANKICKRKRSFAKV